MTFKELKQGYSIYVLDKDGMYVKTAKVMSVSAPHIDKKGFELGANLVVDVVLDINGAVATYTFKEDTDTGYFSSTVITVDKQNIVREVEAIKTQSEEVLSQVDMHKDRLQKCNTILAEFNPAIKEKQAIDERFVKLEGSIDQIKHMLSNIVTPNRYETLSNIQESQSKRVEG